MWFCRASLLAKPLEHSKSTQVVSSVWDNNDNNVLAAASLIFHTELLAHLKKKHEHALDQKLILEGKSF